MDEAPGAPPRRIAMVCLGNICRSPMAEVAARELLAEAGLAGVATVSSYGTAGYHDGEPADADAEDALRRRGWSARGHRARHLTREAADAADLLVCADRANLADVRALVGGTDRVRLLRSFAPGAPAEAEVPDPWGRGPAAFDRALELIEEACRGLVAELGADRR